MLAVGFAKVAFGDGLTAESAALPACATSPHTGGLLTVFLVLRAFASGCTALTGVEAVSNGVPAFEPPKSRNAAATLAIMGALAIDDVRRDHRAGDGRARAHGREPGDLIGLPAGAEQKTALSQIGLAAFGADGAVLPAAGVHRGDPGPRREHRVQRLPGARLAARPRQLPAAPARATAATGSCSRTGSCCWAPSPSLLIVAFDAEVTRLIQLYILGVFLSFTLSQAGMVRHWSALIACGDAAAERRALRRKQVVNGAGAVVDRRSCS